MSLEGKKESRKVPAFYTRRGQVSDGRLGLGTCFYFVCRRLRILQITKNVEEEEKMMSVENTKLAAGHPGYHC